jgi:hydroxymethylpyrimidine pyrophosphatase-like HAD family hydrolase
MNHEIIAVDFDGCIVEQDYPGIGMPVQATVDAIKAAQGAGAKVVLWTCRQGLYLDLALAFCEQQGIRFDAVNENLPEVIEFFGGDSRKIYADQYWDDKAVRMPPP